MKTLMTRTDVSKLIQQIYIVECSQRYSKHVKYRLEHLKDRQLLKNRL